jgi:hypothetical protein
MKCDFSTRQLTVVALGICMAATLSVQNARGTDYQWVTQVGPTDFPTWNDSNHWAPAGIPNSSSDTATIIRPPVAPAANMTIAITSPVTVSDLTINNTSAGGELFSLGDTINAGGNQTLTFQAAAGSASYTETAGPGNGQITVFSDFSVLSDTVMTFDFRDGFNTGTVYNGVITGTSDRTITKEGFANLQLNEDAAAGAYEGQYIINEGALRFVGRSNMAASTGITVNTGGQLQIFSGTGSPDDWSMANGAVLTLNGPGKICCSTNGGALRFQGGPGAEYVRFNNEVVLQSNAVITGGNASVTGELTNVVSGPGDFLKTNGPATILVSNPASGWDGDTTVDGGILSLTNPILSDTSDVNLLSPGVLNLDFTGIDDIHSLFIDGSSQEVGLWGAIGNGLADHQSSLITGDGLLNVVPEPGTGLLALFAVCALSALTVKRSREQS